MTSSNQPARRACGVRRYEEAFAVLRIEGTASAREVKQAYRRAVLDHPPDRDPDGFQRVREAYELLAAPERALDVLTERRTHVEPPAMSAPAPVDLPRELPLAVLRAAVAGIDARALLPDPKSGR